MEKKYSKLYKDFMRIQVAPEDALSLTLVKMGLKDATTVGYDKRLALALKNNGYIYELDESYLQKSIHNFIEYTTSVPLPGARVVRRLYVSVRFSRPRLKQLRAGSSFQQGLAFGFPICDILDYCHKEKIAKKDYIEIFQEWLEQTPAKEGFKYIDFRFIGNLIKYFQSMRLIVHIPCNNICRASLDLADRNLNILEKLDYQFKNYVQEVFNKPILLYGNSWDHIGMMQLDDLKKLDYNSYTATSWSSLPQLSPKKEFLRIKLVPHKRVEVYMGDKKVIDLESQKELKWSYCFILPYDSMKVNQSKPKNESNKGAG